MLCWLIVPGLLVYGVKFIKVFVIENYDKIYSYSRYNVWQF